MMPEGALSQKHGIMEWRLPAVLFLLTMASTTLAGAAYVGADFSRWWEGLQFSVPLLAILLTHELGHFLSARHHGVDVSPPYFIPLPPMLGIGTLGAVIRIREPIASRNALMHIGAARPLAGFAVAVAVISVGVFWSPVETLPAGVSGGLLHEGNSILYASLKWLVHGEFLPAGNRDMMMHPMAFAGWIGLFITMINLIPVGQLDGGHVAFAWFGDRYRRVSSMVHRLLPVFGLVVFAWVTLDEFARISPMTVAAGWRTWLDSAMTGLGSAMPWFLWPTLLWVLVRLSGGMPHPPVGPDELSTNSVRLGVATLILFVVIFMPVPMRVS